MTCIVKHSVKYSTLKYMLYILSDIITVLYSTNGVAIFWLIIYQMSIYIAIHVMGF